MPPVPTPAIKLEPFKRYRIRYIPALARIPREVVLQYLGDEQYQTAGSPVAMFSGRPQMGSTSLAYNQIIDVAETADPIQPYPRKVR